MARPDVKTVVAPVPTAPPEPDVHIVGLKKIAPMRYAVVTGTIANPVVDTAQQPLEYASEAMKIAVLRMLNILP